MGVQRQLSQFVQGMYGLIESGKLAFLPNDETRKPYVILEENFFLTLYNDDKKILNENRRQKILRRVARMVGVDLAKELFISRWMVNCRIFANFIAKAHPDMNLAPLNDDEWMTFAVRNGDTITFMGKVKGREMKLVAVPEEKDLSPKTLSRPSPVKEGEGVRYFVKE